MPPKRVEGRTNTGRISDAALRAAKPGPKPYKIAVGGGLYLEVMPTGAKLWRWKYRLGGKENRFAVGAYPAVLLKEARARAEEARKLVKAGVHPSHQKQLDRIKAGHEQTSTFEAIAYEWLALKDWEEMTKARRLAMLKRVVFPSIGKLPVRQITPAHILDILKRTARTGPTVAAEAKRTMSGVFELAVSTLRAESDPVYPVRKALPANKTKHKRPLSAEEVGQLMRDLDSYHGNFQTVSAFRLMWLTLCRPSEAIEAQWLEFYLDGAIWRIPTERMKKRKEHVIPLSRQSVELLRAMQGLTGRYTHVFPHRDDRTKPMTGNAMRQALYNLGWSGKYSPHATRTTGSTRLNEMGYPADWIERQLAHEEPNAVRRTYNHADYLADRAKMMQQWADMLDAWAGAQDGADVIAMRAVRQTR